MGHVRMGCVLACLAALPLNARAAGTPAGTNIQASAQVTFELDGTTRSVSSNIASVPVIEVLEAVLTLDSPQTPVSAGASRVELVFTLTNTGNGSEAYVLTPLSAGVAGDQFDPQLASPAIYFDTDASGDLSAADVAYVPGSNDPELAADASVRLLLVNDIPATVTNDQRGRSQLTATARTGSGDPGHVIEADGGDPDAVVGSTGARATATGEYIVAGLQLTAMKSQTIADTRGGSRPVRGARITYRIVVTPSGTGTARGTVFADAIPAGTSYVPDSLKLNAAQISDAADGDAGQYVAAPNPEVRIDLGDLAASSGAQVIEFAVTIN